MNVTVDVRRGQSAVIHIVCDSFSEEEHITTLIAAARIYGERNAKYKDNWKKQGWRGGLFKLRLGVERAWDGLWDHPVKPREPWEQMKEREGYIDDLYDAINQAAMTIRAVKDNNRDGNWWTD